MLELDHLVFGCNNLETGKALFEAKTGGQLPSGGHHVTMATENAVGACDIQSYIELISIDPNSNPQMPRWFGLDDPDVQLRLRHEPQLLTWVVRTDNIEATLKKFYSDTLHEMRIFNMERGPYRWLFADRADGSLNNNGLMPNLIQWLTPLPVMTMANSGLRIEYFKVTSKESPIVHAINDSRIQIDTIIDRPLYSLLKNESENR